MAAIDEVSSVIASEAVELSPSTNTLPLSSSGEPPLIVTLAPKSSTAERVLTDEQVDIVDRCSV